jgi:hypothetical protein
MLDAELVWYERAILLERCSLNEALLWVWCRRVPTHGIERPLDGNSLSQLSDWECEVLGIPPVPVGASRSSHRFTKDFLIKKYERLRREARKYHVDEGLCQSVEVRRWLQLVEIAIEEPAAEIFLALRQGQLTASGKLLPRDAPIIEFILDYHSYGPPSRLDDLPNQDISKNSWSANGIDWLSNALTAQDGCYCDISLEVAALLRFFPAHGSPAPKAEFVGAFGDFLVVEGDTPETKHQSERQVGRPPSFAWDAFHLELAELVRSGRLPVKKEAAIQQMFTWFETTQGQKPSRSSISTKLTPYYRRFVY